MSRLLTRKEATRFNKIIDEYKPSGDIIKQFKQSNFGVIAGPAGAGKDTLRNSLTAQYPELYVPILSTTTRPSRQGESNGKTYHFSSIAAFHETLNKREFLQVALVHRQQLAGLHGNEVSKLNPNQYGLGILIVQTEAELRAYHPQIKTIFVIPPNMETLLRRINAQRMLDDSEIKRRLHAAKAELTYALNAPNYYCLVSDTVKHISDTTNAYLQNNIWNKAEDNRGRAAIREILKSLSN